MGIADLLNRIVPYYFFIFLLIFLPLWVVGAKNWSRLLSMSEEEFTKKSKYVVVFSLLAFIAFYMYMVNKPVGKEKMLRIANSEIEDWGEELDSISGWLNEQSFEPRYLIIHSRGGEY